jgi:L-iditol 2-dehydrogenase
MKKKLMRVAMYYRNHDVRIENQSIPEINPRELLVKVMASGICGSDVLEWYRIKKAPLVLGHEIAGEIVEKGSEVEGYEVGQRVFVSHHVPCNICKYCLNGHHTACEMLHNTNFFPGGFSEYLQVPSVNVDRGVFILPDEVSFEEGTFIEPVACVVRAQRKAKLQPGQSVLILGSGISGLLQLLLAKKLGASRVFMTDINEFRLKKATEFGADAVRNAQDDVRSWLYRSNHNQLADLVIICTGAKNAFDQAFSSVDRGGTVLFFATTDPDTEVTVPVNDFWRNDVKIMPSYGCSPLDITIAIELLRSKQIQVKPMITHRIPLGKAALGFKMVSEAKDSIKVIIQPHDQ